MVAFVEVGRSDGWKSLGAGEGKELSIISASVRGSVVHHGIRGLVSRFPLAFALMSSISFFVILSVILAMCILPTVLQSTPQDAGGDEKPKLPISQAKSSASSSDSDEETLWKRRPRRGNSVRRSEVKIEQTGMPPAKVKSDPLRRRSSRPFDLSDSD
ncbi:hypothetical protein H0H81_000960 [Sphagnurus paluster]|uniref:Uncharacterized protein n=1 Tax=Sphagnurus paluster TaxID=117069 RepID=A0A9P7KK59_9AGAR|nr:hypothetical protein H0H81_000960 [Sphagnurus paluster]